MPDKVIDGRFARAPEPPCGGCPDRRVGCHDPEVCPRWADYTRNQEAYRETRIAAERKTNVIAEYHGRKKWRLRKRRSEE